MKSLQNKENLNANIFRDDESRDNFGAKRARYKSNQPEFEKVNVKKVNDMNVNSIPKGSSKIRTAVQSKTNLNFNPSEEKFQSIKFIKSMNH